MTRRAQKQLERFFVEEAARSLGKAWAFSEDREHPDFTVTDGVEKFGLEVCEIFIGHQDHAGSAMKASESRTNRALNAIRLEYEAVSNVPLTVKFVGNTSEECLATVVPALIANDFQSRQVGYQTVVDTGLGLRVYATKAFRPDWFSVNDRVGFVDRNPQKIVAEAIEEKSKQLGRYQECAGSDIRLMLVANRFQNSGKLILQDEGIEFDFHGFRAVYLYPYPETVVCLRKSKR